MEQSIVEVIPGVFKLKSEIYEDGRGHFRILHNLSKFAPSNWYQDCMSASKKNVIRGLHWQHDPPLTKLVSVINGSILDVLVDLRDGLDYGKVTTLRLDKTEQLFIPPLIAHGFAALDDNTIVHYKFSHKHNPNAEECINAFCPRLAIDWGISKEDAILSERDTKGLTMEEWEDPWRLMPGVDDKRILKKY